MSLLSIADWTRGRSRISPLQDQNKEEVELSDSRGSKEGGTVFYPWTEARTCTEKEGHACSLNDMRKFRNAGCGVLGVSVDSVWSHKALPAEEKLRDPGLADGGFHPKGAMAKSYGVYMGIRGFTGAPIHHFIDKSRESGVGEELRGHSGGAGR